MRFFASLLSLSLIAAAAPAVAFEDDWRERGLETPIGLERGRMQEEAMPFLRDEHGARVEIRAPYGTTLSTAIGNLINVEAERGATVILNAMQINRGEQRAITTIDGASAEAWLHNVEPAAGEAD